MKRSTSARIQARRSSEDYQVPFKFTGKIITLVIRLGEGRLSPEDEKAIEEARSKAGLSR